MTDPYVAPSGRGYTPIGRFLAHVAVIEFASRDADAGIVGVYLSPWNALVAVAGPRGTLRYGPFAYDTSRAQLVEKLVHPAGLAEPPPEPAELPYYPDPGAPPREYWSGLLLYLGAFAYVLHEDGDRLWYESIELDPGKVASVTVVDEHGRRWISRIALDPPRKEVGDTAIDIAHWISEGRGERVDDETKVFELRDR